MDPTRADPDRTARPRPSLLRRVLLTRLTETGVRIVDVVILPIGAVVAFFVCIPILIATTAAGALIGEALRELGLTESVYALFGLGGFIGGLALGFVVLLRLYRRLPTRIRAWVTPDDDEPIAALTALPLGRDPAADAATLGARLATADATLAIDVPTQADERET